MPAAAAGPPSTDVYLVDVLSRGSEPELGEPLNLTDRDGYDNQPLFEPGGSSLLYTSIRADAQADVYRYDLTRRRASRVTRTAESEYSPTVVPGGEAFSVVRVEADSAQRLWLFALDGRDPRLLLPHVEPVGYHAWADEHTLALFVLGSPPTLRLADLRSGEVSLAAENVGRSLQRVPGRRAISFVQKNGEDDWRIQLLDLETRRVEPLAPTLPGVEDHVWWGDGILTADDSRLYLWSPAAPASGWRLIADLARSGIRGITRIAVGPAGDRLALVARRD